jgi:hypothetical protein
MSDDNIIDLPTKPKPKTYSTGLIDLTHEPDQQEQDADAILEASKGIFQSVLVVGYDQEGGITAVFQQDLASANLLLDEVKQWILSQ